MSFLGCGLSLLLLLLHLLDLRALLTPVYLKEEFEKCIL